MPHRVVHAHRKSKSPPSSPRSSARSVASSIPSVQSFPRQAAPEGQKPTITPVTGKSARKIREEIQRSDAEREQQRILNKPLPLNFLIASIELSVASKFLMRDLVIYIPFVISYVLIVVLGRGGSSVYWTSRAVFDKVGGNEIPGTFENGPFFDKLFPDTQIPVDIYDWVEGVVYNNIWTNENDSETSEISYYAGSNQGIGVVRFRHLKVTPNSCEVNENFYPDPPNSTAQPVICWAEWSDSYMDEAPYGGPFNDSLDVPLWVRPGNEFIFQECLEFGQRTTGRITSYPCDGYSLQVPFTASRDQAMDVISRMRTYGFVDQWATRFFIVEYFVYNTALDTFTSSKFFYEVLEGGAILGTVRTRGFNKWTQKDLARTVFEFLFLLFVLYYWLKFFLEWREHGKKFGGKYIGYIFGLWNMLEIVNLVTFMLTFIFRWIWWSESNKSSFSLPFPDEYPSTLERLLSTFYAQVWCNALNTVITFLKLLKFVRLNDQFNILTRTMEASASGIVGVLFIFILVVLAFAITGIALFGSGIEEYRDMNTSFSSLMRILVGDFDYPALRDENAEVAAIFFWAYTILGLFLLLNFLIAVIGEGFSKENAKTRAQPLDQVIYRRIKLLKRKCSADFLKRILDLIRRRTRRIPQATVLQYLIEHRNTLARPAEDADLESDEDLDSEDDLPDADITRIQLIDIIPLTEYNEIGERFFDELWDNMVHEYEVQNKDEEKEAAAEEQRFLEGALAEILQWLIPPKGGVVTKEDREREKQKKREEEQKKQKNLFGDSDSLLTTDDERDPGSPVAGPSADNPDDDIYVTGGVDDKPLFNLFAMEDSSTQIKKCEKKVNQMDEYAHNVARMLCIVEKKVLTLSTYSKGNTDVKPPEMPINGDAAVPQVKMPPSEDGGGEMRERRLSNLSGVGRRRPSLFE